MSSARTRRVSGRSAPPAARTSSRVAYSSRWRCPKCASTSGASSGAAVYYRDSVIARIAGLGWLVFGVPHLIYHAFHRPETLSGFNFTLELLAALALPALGLAILLVAPRERFPVPEPAPFTFKFPRR